MTKPLSRESVELLLCPFCGHTPKNESWHGGAKTKRRIGCVNEECSAMPSVTGQTNAKAIEAWNRRASLRPDEKVSEGMTATEQLAAASPVESQMPARRATKIQEAHMSTDAMIDTKTPRTDAVALDDIIVKQSRLLGADRYAELLDHARQLEAELAAETRRLEEVQQRAEVAYANAALPARILAICKARGWSLHWTARGAYLHLEASELIEALRGKRGDPLAEAADVLIMLMSITESADLKWHDVVMKATETVTRLETEPRYKSEEYDAALARQEKRR